MEKRGKSEDDHSVVKYGSDEKSIGTNDDQPRCSIVEERARGDPTTVGPSQVMRATKVN